MTGKDLFFLLTEDKTCCYKGGKENASVFVTNAIKCCSPNNKDHAISNFGTLLEVNLRKALVHLLNQRKSLPEVLMNTTSSDIYKIIIFSIHIAELVAVENDLVHAVLIIRKIPFLMLEDIFESQPASGLYDLWTALIIPLSPKLTSQDLFSAGKNLLLRLCNSLLRRLSRPCHTSLVGSIKMFLASAFAISDPSAVNMTRRHNISNVVKCESKASYSAELNNRTGVTGEKRTDSTGEEAAEEDGRVGIPLQRFRFVETDTVASENEFTLLPYDVYAKFWGLQPILAAEKRGVVDPLPLLHRCKDILSLLESSNPPCIDTNSEKARLCAAIELAIMSQPPDFAGPTDEKTTPAHKSEQEYLGVRYLTAPELLPLQLRSNPFREQVAVQMLIAFQSLRSHQRNLALAYVPPVDSPLPADNSQSDNVETNNTKVHDPRNPRAFEVWLSGQLKGLEDRCFALLSSTLSGTRIAAVLRRVLWRELKWSQWKEQQCPKLSRDQLKLPKMPKKDFVSAYVNEMNSQIAFSFCFSKSLLNAQKLVKQLSDSIPSFDKHVEAFLDAEDPDNGIDDEYHPRHDSVYCWRAGRLLAQQSVQSFACMESGDLRLGLKAAALLRSADHNANAGKPEILLKPRTLDPKVNSCMDSTMDTAPTHENSSTALKIAAEAETDESANVQQCAESEVAANTDHMDCEIEPGDADVCCVQITEYKHSETEESLRNYVEAFTSVKEVRLIKSSKRGSESQPKYALVWCTKGAGFNDLLTTKKHILNHAALKICTWHEPTDTLQAVSTSRFEHIDSKVEALSQQDNELDVKQPSKKARHK